MPHAVFLNAPILARFLPQEANRLPWSRELATDIQGWGRGECQGSRVESVVCLRHLLTRHQEALFLNPKGLTQTLLNLLPKDSPSEVRKGEKLPCLIELGSSLARDYRHETLEARHIAAALLEHPEAPPAARTCLVDGGIKLSEVTIALVGDRPPPIIDELQHMTVPELTEILRSEMAAVVRGIQRIEDQERSARAAESAAAGRVRILQDEIEKVKKDYEDKLKQAANRRGY